MRRLSTLKTIVDILFVLAMIGLIFLLPLILMLIIIPEQVPFKWSTPEGVDLEPKSPELIICMFSSYIGFAFFVYALYLFRKTLDLFKRRIFFDDRVIKNFDQTGKAIIIAVMIFFATAILLRFTSNPISLELDFGLNSSLMTAGLGLFFIVLSDVFAMAKRHKEDNDLTV